MHAYIRLTFWLLFSVVELVLFCAHICMMPFTCLGGAGLILDGMKCIFLIFLGTILSVLHYIFSPISHLAARASTSTSGSLPRCPSLSLPSLSLPISFS